MGVGAGAGDGSGAGVGAGAGDGSGGRAGGDTTSVIQDESNTIDTISRPNSRHLIVSLQKAGKVSPIQRRQNSYQSCWCYCAASLHTALESRIAHPVIIKYHPNG
jgi:hypothetical protein